MTLEETERFVQAFLVELEEAVAEANKLVPALKLSFAAEARLTRKERLASAGDVIGRANIVLQLEPGVSRLHAELVSLRETTEEAKRRREIFVRIPGR